MLPEAIPASVATLLNDIYLMSVIVCFLFNQLNAPTTMKLRFSGTNISEITLCTSSNLIAWIFCACFSGVSGVLG